jgi:hypothetical protein
MDIERMKELSGIQLNEAESAIAKVGKMDLHDAKNYAWKIIKKNGDLTQDDKLIHAEKVIKCPNVATVQSLINNILKRGSTEANIKTTHSLNGNK